MIKIENYGKITENSRNFLEKFPKNPKNLPARGGVSRLKPQGGGIFKKKFLRGYYGYIFPWPCLFKPIDKLFSYKKNFSLENEPRL